MTSKTKNIGWKRNFTEYPLNRPEKIHIDFWDRHWENKIFYLIYRVIRIVHVSIWFYFFPLLALVVNYFGEPFYRVMTKDDS